MAKETWTKSAVLGIYDALLSVDKILFRPPLATELMECPVKKYEDFLNETLHEMKENTND